MLYILNLEANHEGLLRVRECLFLYLRAELSLPLCQKVDYVFALREAMKHPILNYLFFKLGNRTLN